MLQLQRQLSEQLQNLLPSDTRFHLLRVQGKSDNAVLAWLKGIAFFPQCYFRARDNQQMTAGIGEIISFSSVENARQFVQQYDLPLLGGLQFDGTAHFFLPQLLWQQTDKHLQLTLIIDQDNPKSHESARELLNSLSINSAFEPINVDIQLQNQHANQVDWQNWVTNALHKIAERELDKVVLANESRFQSEQPINPYDFLRLSETQNQGCYHFLWAQSSAQYFVGSSPERLYLREQNLLFTEALAGTALISATKSEDHTLLNDDKNRYENECVVQDICAQLATYTDKIDVGQLALKQLRQVQHLYCPIQAQLKPQVSDKECLTAIHPTAAIAGLPRQAALKFIRECEGFDRSWYAGTLGMMSAAHAEFCVTIRSAFIEGNQLRVFAGAGIVAGSIPQAEWQEIERKASALVSLLN